MCVRACVCVRVRALACVRAFVHVCVCVAEGAWCVGVGEKGFQTTVCKTCHSIALVATAEAWMRDWPE